MNAAAVFFGMQRRDRIGRGLAAALVGAFAVMVAAAHAQQAPRLIGYLGSGAPESYVEHLAGFRDGLKDAGVVEGRDAAFEFRWAYGDYGKLPSLAADLVRRQVGVIAATGGNPTAFAAKAATSTIPIVFTIGDDPVEIGLVASLSRPGGNVTGALNCAQLT